MELGHRNRLARCQQLCSVEPLGQHLVFVKKESIKKLLQRYRLQSVEIRHDTKYDKETKNDPSVPEDTSVAAEESLRIVFEGATLAEGEVWPMLEPVRPDLLSVSRP